MDFCKIRKSKQLERQTSKQKQSKKETRRYWPFTAVTRETDVLLFLHQPPPPQKKKAPFFMHNGFSLLLPFFFFPPFFFLHFYAFQICFVVKTTLTILPSLFCLLEHLIAVFFFFSFKATFFFFCLLIRTKKRDGVCSAHLVPVLPGQLDAALRDNGVRLLLV